jgi:hypothetical protein
LRVSRDGPPDIISYSFDMLLPIIRLRESHYKVDLKTWARYLFLLSQDHGLRACLFPDRRTCGPYQVVLAKLAAQQNCQRGARQVMLLSRVLSASGT